jgi:hypothetical protein
MSAKDKRARRLLAAMPQAERIALRDSIRSAFLADGTTDGRRQWRMAEDRLAIAAGSVTEAVRKRKAEADRKHSERMRQEAIDAAAFDVLSGGINWSARAYCVSGERLRAYESMVQAAAIQAADTMTVRLAAGRINHWPWIIRPVPQNDTTKPAGRMRDYPLGYASARGGWRYRAGCEQSTVQGAIGTPQVRIAHSETLAYVPPEVVAAAVASGENPAIAVKWARRYTAINSPVVIWSYEQVDWSLQASGINTRKGYSRERSGKSYSPSSKHPAKSLAESIVALAQAAKRIERRAADMQAAKRDRERRDRERQTAQAAKQLRYSPRLVRE